ncbi:MAG: glycosyltransferase family 2 protein [Bacillota bacterium]
MPAISIIVPIYNVEQYLHRCLDSILAQTFTDFELILVNDGSTDNSGEICDLYAEKDTRIKIIYKKNGGLSDARNSGIKIAQGDFIGFIDSDDWIEPNMYEILYNLCIENNVDISTCSFNIWDKGERRKVKINKKSVTVLDSKTALQNMYDGKLPGYVAWNKLYKKHIFETIRFPKGRIYEDAAIMYRVYDSTNGIAFIEYPLYNYIYRESSITRSEFSEKRFDVVFNYNEAYSYLEMHHPEMCEKLNSIYYRSLRNMLVDIVNEKSIFKNFHYIERVSKLIRNHNYNSKILKNNLIPLKHKILAQLLAWCPRLAILFYKIRIFTI